MDVIEGILSVFNKLIVKDALATLGISKEEILEMLENQASQCEEIVTDNELMEHEKGPFRNELKRIRICVNKIKAA
jgi:hypothetical protein